MNVHDFETVVTNAERKIKLGWTVFQQFNCGQCGTKQTMSAPNKFYTEGVCEECGGLTDIVRDGCNFMGIWEGEQGKGVGDVLKGMVTGGGEGDEE